MDLFIKNMVCPRCIAAVEELLQEQHMGYTTVDLGHAVLDRELTSQEVTAIKALLKKIRF